MQFVIVLPADDAHALEDVVEQAREREETWRSEARRLVDEAHAGAYGREEREAQRRALEDLRARLEQGRREGKLLGSRSRLIGWHLEAAMAARGWEGRQWPALPENQTRRPGRRWGSRNRPKSEERARLAIDLPAELGEQLRRACYWHSQPAADKLAAWADRFGPVPLSILGAALQADAGTGPKAKDMTERDELRRQIVTTADVLREAIDRAITADLPEPPPL